MSSIIHCQNMLFLVGLKFNNLTGSVNTPLYGLGVLPCVRTSEGARSYVLEGWRDLFTEWRCCKSRLSLEIQPSADRSPT